MGGGSGLANPSASAPAVPAANEVEGTTASELPTALNCALSEVAADLNGKNKYRRRENPYKRPDITLII